MAKIVLFGPTSHDPSKSMRIYPEALYRALALASKDHQLKLVLPKSVKLPFAKDILYKELIYPGLARDLRADINHITDHSYGSLARFLDPAKTVATCHDLNALELPEQSSWVGRLRFKYNLSALQRLPHLIVDSEYTKRTFLKHFDYKGKIHVVPLGLNPGFKKFTQSERNRLKTKYRLDESKTYLLHVGHSNPVKNVELIIETLGRLPQSFYLIKVGQFTPDQEQKIKNLGLSARIKQFTNFSTNQLAEVYNISDILLVPSFFEGFGLPVLEAMASGLPVIAAKAGALPEVGNSAALYINPYSSKDLTKKILMLKNNPNLKKRIIRLGLKQAQKFSWEECARKTFAVYEELMAATVSPEAEPKKSTVVSPLRCVDIGGWLDTWFAKHGEVLNLGVLVRPFGSRQPFQGISVSKLVHAAANGVGLIEIKVNNKVVESLTPKELNSPDRVAKSIFLASLKRAGTEQFIGKETYLEIGIPVPAGSSLGASGAIAVTLIKSILGPKVANVQAAQMAWEAETKIMGGQSGTQDQFSASFAQAVNLIKISD